MRVPNIEDAHVKVFCKEISPEHSPQYVPLYPMPGAPYRCCFDIVDICIREAKGTNLMGWAIWEWPDVFIEAELHCVWKAPDGKLFDPTPQRFQTENRNLFLPDPEHPEPRRAIDNRRKALSSDPAAQKLIRAFELRYRRPFPFSLWHSLQANYYGLKCLRKHGSAFRSR